MDLIDYKYLVTNLHCSTYLKSLLQFIFYNSNKWSS